MEFELEVEMDMDSSSSVADHDKLCTSDNIINIDQKHHEAEVEEEEEKHNIFHVLAVDDSNIDRKLLHKLLTVSSYQVTCVDSGDKALEYLGLLEYETSSSSSTTLSHLTSSKSQPEASKVNLIMTDYSMPGISGYDLLKRIKDSTWKDVPVVVMSSENVPSRINMCLEGGAEEFILKPVKLSDLSKLQSHILKNTINTTQHDPNPQDDHQVTPKTDDVSAITSNEGKIVTTMNDINRDDNGSDKNCCNANKRKAMLTTPSDLSDRRAFVQELPVS